MPFSFEWFGGRRASDLDPGPQMGGKRGKSKRRSAGKRARAARRKQRV